MAEVRPEPIDWLVELDIARGKLAEVFGEPGVGKSTLTRALAAAVSGIPDDLIGRPEAPGKWSVRQIVQHLADSELVGGFRFRMVLAHDRPAVPAYDQDAWAERLRYADSDVATALADFTTLRRANLRLFERATDAERARVGIHSERGEESLDRMMQLYAGHDLVHLRQIARVRAAVGAA